MLFFLLTWTTNAQDIPQNVWLCEYFDARGNVISTRVEDTIKHDFNKVVMDGVQKEGLGARWTGDFQVDSLYTMSVTSDKSMRILVDNGVLISDLYNATKNTYSVTIQPNTVHRIVIEYNLNNRVVFAGDSTWVDDSEQDKIIYYNNWRISDTLAIPEQDGNCYCSWSQSANDSLVFRFTKATGFVWVGERMSHHGVAEIYLNDEYKGLIDTYSPDNSRLTYNWAINNLDTAKVYKFTLVATGNKNPASTGTAVVIQGFVLKNAKYVPPEPPIDLENPITIGDSLLLTVSSYENDINVSSKMFDGLLNTKWAGLGRDQWLMFTLPEVQVLESIDIAWMYNRLNYYGLQVSVDSANWTTVIDEGVSGEQNEWQVIDFADIEARYVKFLAKGNDLSEWNSIAEIRLKTSPVIIEPPDPPVVEPGDIDIVRQGYFIVLKDGVQFEGGHSEYDKAVEKAVNLLLKNPTSNILIQAPSWRVEY